MHGRWQTGALSLWIFVSRLHCLFGGETGVSGSLSFGKASSSWWRPWHLSVSYMLRVEAKGLLALLLTFSETDFFLSLRLNTREAVLFCPAVDNARGAVWMYWCIRDVTTWQTSVTNGSKEQPSTSVRLWRQRQAYENSTRIIFCFNCCLNLFCSHYCCSRTQ